MSKRSDQGMKVLIAVIDSGVITSISDLQNYVIRSTGYRVNPDGFISEFPDIEPSAVHGTCIALTIRDICSNVSIISINILNENLATDCRIMLYAINEALKLNPDIIHMSLGTTKLLYRTYFKKLAEIANFKNTIIVAACNNFGFWSFPAFIKGVVGVKSIKIAVSKMQFYKKTFFYYAPSNLTGIRGMENLKCNRMNGTSVSAAYITGHIANIIYNEEVNSNLEILTILKHKNIKLQK